MAAFKERQIALKTFLFFLCKANIFLLCEGVLYIQKWGTEDGKAALYLNHNNFRQSYLYRFKKTVLWKQYD